ncbi:MAG: hypothetical protein GTO63_23680, partial [Anaerolineae bacterium]|nr:hypothetical protein [Anaerolineae bacterium]NIN97727.1 hypothetical protein [Anaerolineae bacterium]NIQ80708.1 hypothetical protein [Anaerolineae bacterium]
MFNGIEPVPPKPCPDLNGDGDVNNLDIFKLYAGWVANEGDPNYDPFLDLNDDESINMLDVFELFPLWLGTCPLYLEYNGDGVRTSQTVGKFVTDYDWD